MMKIFDTLKRFFFNSKQKEEMWDKLSNNEEEDLDHLFKLAMDELHSDNSTAQSRGEKMDKYVRASLDRMKRERK